MVSWQRPIARGSALGAKAPAFAQSAAAPINGSLASTRQDYADALSHPAEVIAPFWSASAEQDNTDTITLHNTHNTKAIILLVHP